MCVCVWLGMIEEGEYDVVASVGYYDDLMRRLSDASVNATGDTLETGAIVAIVLGGVAVLVLFVGALWWAFFRPGTGSGGATGFVAVKPSFQPFGFTASAEANETAEPTPELPLLRMGSSAASTRVGRRSGEGPF